MRKSLLAAALALLFGAVASRPALAMGDETIRAHVSFPFHVLDRALPPGDYVIKSAEGIDPALYKIWRADGNTAMFFLTEGGEADRGSQDAHLVFDQVGGETFLRKIVVPGETGRELMVSSAESQAALAAARAASGSPSQPRSGD